MAGQRPSVFGNTTNSFSSLPPTYQQPGSSPFPNPSPFPPSYTPSPFSSIASGGGSRAFGGTPTVQSPFQNVSQPFGNPNMYRTQSPSTPVSPFISTSSPFGQRTNASPFGQQQSSSFSSSPFSQQQVIPSSPFSQQQVTPPSPFGQQMVPSSPGTPTFVMSTSPTIPSPARSPVSLQNLTNPGEAPSSNLKSIDFIEPSQTPSVRIERRQMKPTSKSKTVQTDILRRYQNSQKDRKLNMIFEEVKKTYPATPETKIDEVAGNIRAEASKLDKLEILNIDTLVMAFIMIEAAGSPTSIEALLGAKTKLNNFFQTETFMNKFRTLALKGTKKKKIPNEPQFQLMQFKTGIFSYARNIISNRF